MFVGKIPRDLYEDELVPLFESAGAIWDLRLMMDPLSGQNRGYAFITYCNKDDAQKAVKLVSTISVLYEKIPLDTLFKWFRNASRLLTRYFNHFPSGFLFFFSVITTKSALESTWVCVYPSQTIACLSDQFLKTRQERVYWRTSAKLQVKFQMHIEGVSPEKC